MRLPSFPSDFKVLYTEGGSYWWWSPDTGPDWDGTMPVGDPSPWPVGLMVGNEDTTSHEFEVGDEVIVVWDVDEVSNRVERTIVFQGDHALINQSIEEVLIGVLSPD